MYNDRDEATSKEIDRSTSRIATGLQQKLLAELYDNLSTLESRLKPVLTPYPPFDDEAEVSPERAVQSPLADAVDLNNSALNAANRKVRSLIESLEC